MGLIEKYGTDRESVTLQAIYENFIPQKLKQAGEAVMVELPLVALEQAEAGDTGSAVRAKKNVVADAAATNEPFTTHRSPFASAGENGVDTVFQKFLRPQLAKALFSSR
eukprot:SAG31_NODE_2815_length_5045_cov_3.196522_7_plen_109_part_00